MLHFLLLILLNIFLLSIVVVVVHLAIIPVTPSNLSVPPRCPPTPFILYLAGSWLTVFVCVCVCVFVCVEMRSISFEMYYIGPFFFLPHLLLFPLSDVKLPFGLRVLYLRLLLCDTVQMYTRSVL